MCQKNYQSSVSILRSHIFLQMLKMIAQSIASTSSHKERPAQEHQGSSSSTYCASGFWLLFCLENSLSQIAILDEMGIIFCQSCISLGQFVCFFQIATTYAPSLKYHFVLTLMPKCFYKVSSWDASKLTKYLTNQSITLRDLLEQIVHSHTPTQNCRGNAFARDQEQWSCRPCT